MNVYYQRGDVTIYHGDCLEILPGLSGIDAVVTDPPYGVGKEYDGIDDTLELFQNTILMIANSGKPASAFVPVCRIMDLPVRPQWIGAWSKHWGGSGLLAYPIYPHWEAIAFYNIKGDFKGNKGHRSDVFSFAPTRPIPGGHPTPKPEDLMEAVVEFFNKPCICDPFTGSGTTAIACIHTNRKFVGIEQSEQYCEIAAKRCDRELDQGRLFKPEPVREVQRELIPA